MTDFQRSQTPSNGFPPTRWSVVLAARQRPSAESGAALETICRAYWQPLYNYVRRCGQSAHDAEDLTQEFFRRLLEKRWLDSADREKGRLRTFLILALKRFMVSEWRRASSQRRGGGEPHVQMDTTFAESHSAGEVNPEIPPDEAFDCQWAIGLQNLTLERLEGEFQGAGKADEFEILKEYLMAARGAIDYSSVAASLGVGEGAARVAVHRMRKRFREIYREEVAHTVEDPEQVEMEVRHLAQALARS